MNTEFILGRRQAEKKTHDTSADRGCIVHPLFLCPICGRYTLHMPRYGLDRHWYIDHKLVPVESFDGMTVTTVLLPVEYCKLDINPPELLESERFTRTVIRVQLD